MDMDIKRRALEGYLVPEGLYTLRAFRERMGISATRIHHAQKGGITPPWFSVGRRKFVTGGAAIDYIQRLAEWERAQ